MSKIKKQLSYDQFKNDKRLQIKIRTCEMLTDRANHYYHAMNRDRDDVDHHIDLIKKYHYYSRLAHLHIFFKDLYIENLLSEVKEAC